MKKGKVNFKIYDVQTGQQIPYHPISQEVKTTRQWNLVSSENIIWDMFFLEKPYTKWGEVTGLLLKNQKLSISLLQQSEIFGVIHISIFVRSVSYWHKQNDPTTLCHMRHSLIFDKIYSFLKPVLNIFILRNLIL